MAVRVGAVLRVNGRLRVTVHDPLSSEDRRRTPRADALDQLGQHCSGSYLLSYGPPWAHYLDGY
jgi:hypothetical protein